MDIQPFQETERWDSLQKTRTEYEIQLALARKEFIESILAYLHTEHQAYLHGPVIAWSEDATEHLGFRDWLLDFSISDSGRGIDGGFHVIPGFDQTIASLYDDPYEFQVDFNRAYDEQGTAEVPGSAYLSIDRETGQMTLTVH